MDMYSPEQLRSIYGSGPETFLESDKQVGMLQSMYKQKTAEQEQDVETKNLANLYTRQNDPQRLEQQRLQNEGSVQDNISKGVKARSDTFTEPFKMDEARRAQALAIPDHEIKMKAAQAQQMMYSDDPAVQAKGQRLMQMSQAAVEAKQKHAYEMEKQELIRRSAEKIAAGRDATARYGVDQRAASAKDRKAVNATVEGAIASAKGSDQRVGIYEAAARTAMLQGDNELAQYYATMGQRERTGRVQERGASSVVTQGAASDNRGAMGIPSAPVAPPVSNVPAIPGIGAPAAPAPVKANVPSGAVQMLKSNPALAAQFDAKYGAGASKQYLGK